MSTVTTTRPVNAGQLSAELGQPLSTASSGGTTTVTCHDPGTTDAALQTAVDAHVAIDEQANATTLRDRAASALAANATFLAIVSPTNAQTLAQVKALTRQNSAIIRLVIGKLDSTD